MWLAASITDHVCASIPKDVYGAFREALSTAQPAPARRRWGRRRGQPASGSNVRNWPLWARHTLGNESALGDGLPPGLSSSIRRGRQPVQAGPGGPHVLFFRASAHAAMGVLLLLGVDEVKWPWLPHRAAPAEQDGPSKERECARVAEGGTSRRPHARPEAALPTAKPAALTQYRNSSPIATHSDSQRLTRLTRASGTLPSARPWPRAHRSV
jgi:hypothetical protein